MFDSSQKLNPKFYTKNITFASVSKILGISAFYHDASAALVVDGQVVAAVSEERFSRIKHDKCFPAQSIAYCLKFSGISIDELDAVVFYEKPFLKFERLLETYYGFAPRGFRSFLKAIPVWISEKLFLKQKIKKNLSKVMDYDQKKLKLLFSDHHLSHAASAFYPSNFKKAAVLTIDGVGEYATTRISLGENNKIRPLFEQHFPHSIGLFYSAVTQFLGFRVNNGEYKVMGLAPYSNKKSNQSLTFLYKIKDHLLKVNKDGSVFMDQAYFNYATGLTMIDQKKWQDLFGFSQRLPDQPLEQKHADLAQATQQVLEEVVLKLAAHAKALTGADYLCMAGGVALNCVANATLRDQKVFKDIFVQPASSDAGSALGSALAVQHLCFTEQSASTQKDKPLSMYLGPSYSKKDLEAFNQKKGFSPEKLELVKIAKALHEGKIIGWFQGRLEFGPRALGNRSILADVAHPLTQEKINKLVKKREDFRPFAPVVVEQHYDRYFKASSKAPYMLFTHELKDELKIEKPQGFDQLSLKEKRTFVKSAFPAITHIDYSARVQTVNEKQNKKLYNLLKAFEQFSGHAMLVNTSFNQKGAPIVCSPEDAYACFLNSGMDVLVMGDFVYLK